MLRSVMAAVLLTCCASTAFGWNALGHKVVAEIAWRQLDAGTQQQIVDALRRHPRFDADFAAQMTDDALKGDKSVQDHWNFQHAATWPDIARGIKGDEQKNYDRPLWHYIDVPLYLDPTDRRAFGGMLPVNVSTEYPTRTPIDQYNVLQAIAYSRAVLKSKAGPDVKALAYCWLFHLVGDVHQPLHSTALFSIAHFPKGDRGGNEIPLTRGKNLHSLWDNLLGRQHYMRNVDKAVAELSDRTRYGEVWESAPKETDPRKWADESHALCESFVYDDAIRTAVRATPPGVKLTPIELPEAYYKAAGEHARRRIIAAGLRLATLLEQSASQKSE